MWGYIGIYCHDGICKRVTVLYSKSRKSPPRAILTTARVGPYVILYTIYIPPYAIPPTTLTPGSKVRGHRVSGLGSPWSRVFAHGHWSHGHPGFWITGSIGSLVSGLSMAMVSIGSWARVKPTAQGRAQGQTISPWSKPSQQPRVKTTNQG
jgi:hypothetical protein